MAKQTHQEKGGDRLTKDNDGKRCQHGQRLLDQNQRIKQHTDGDKEQDGKRVAQRQGIVGRAVAQFRFIQYHPGKERAQREGDIKQFHRAESDT